MQGGGILYLSTTWMSNTIDWEYSSNLSLMSISSYVEYETGNIYLLLVAYSLTLEYFKTDLVGCSNKNFHLPSPAMISLLVFFKIRNEGSNRFNCFRCDFDICRECGEEEMAALRSAKINRVSSLYMDRQSPI